MGPCQKLNCNNKKDKWVLFDGNRGYYGFCTATPVLFKCPDEENYIFDLASNKCVYNCITAGDYVDRFDCTKYITCDRSGGRWNVISQQCAKNYYFKGGKCIRGTCESDITTPEPSTTLDPNASII